MIFVCRKAEELNGLGEVWARGAEWREPRVFMEEAMNALGQLCWKVAGVVAFLGCIFGALLRVDVIAERALIFGAAIFALGFALMWFGWRFPARKCELLFGRDGAIRWGRGLEGTRVPGYKAHDTILNIEAVPKTGLRRDSETTYTHCVRLLMESGGTIRVGNNLEEDQARRIVATLMAALTTVRSEIEVAVGDFVDIT